MWVIASPEAGRGAAVAEGDLHAGRARDVVRGRGGGLRRDGEPRRAGGAQRRAALTRPPRPRAGRPHGPGERAGRTAAARPARAPRPRRPAARAGTSRNETTWAPLTRSPCARACSGLTRAGLAPNLRAAVPETGP